MADETQLSVDSQKHLVLQKDETAFLDKVYENPESLSQDEANDALMKAQTQIPQYLQQKVNTDIEGTLRIMAYTSQVKFAVDRISSSARPKYLSVLKLHVKSKDKDERFFELIHSFISGLKPKFTEMGPLLSALFPYTYSSDAVFLTILSFLTSFNKESHPFLEEQLEILILDENYLASFKILSSLFAIDTPFAVHLFKTPTFQSSLLKINLNYKTMSSKVIMSVLSLLSNACVDSELRNFIIEKYLDILIFALKSTNDLDIQALSGLVILKTWSFETLASKEIKIDDLYEIFLNNLNGDSIEGLSYITLKKSIRIRLRADETLIFELFDKLRNKEDKNVRTYGILTIFANLSTFEEKNEMTELKKQAQKNLEDSIEESEEEIVEFRKELVERRLVEIISGFLQTKNISQQSVKILYNLIQVKSLRPDIIKQGGLHLLIKILGDTGDVESRNTGLKALSKLLTSSDPNLIFNRDSPKTAFNYIFYILQDSDSFTPGDQAMALISLTNLSLLESIGTLSPKQWEIIDSYLLSDNVLLRRSSIELVSNLLQHRANLVSVFNFESSVARKRLDAIVKYTQLEDIESQCAALGALSFGVSISFICEEIVKNSSLVEYCTFIINRQTNEAKLIERTLFILYYIVFYSEQTNGLVVRGLKGNSQLKRSLIQISKRKDTCDNETIELALEILQIVQFS